MEGPTSRGAATAAELGRMPAGAPTGTALLALVLGEQARGLRGLDVLRRSVDRAPPDVV